MKYAAFVVLSLSSAGCVDAKGSFDQFGNRIVDADVRDIDATIVTSLPNVTGDFYTVARGPFVEDKFFNFRATFEFHPVSENTAKFDWSAQALDFMTMEPVGTPFVVNDVQVGADAMAEIPLVGSIDGHANPVTGTTISSDAIIHTTLVTEDFLCGTLTGIAGGFALDGTTFGAVRITGTDLPPPVWRCEDQPQ